MCEECKEIIEDEINNEIKGKTKVCKTCGEEKPIEEFTYDGKQYRTPCKVCSWLKRHKNLQIKKDWTLNEYKIILDYILNNKSDCINDIVQLLNNKTLDELINLLKNELRIGTFNHTNLKIKKICPNCNKEFYITLAQTKQICCNQKCSIEYKVSNNNVIVQCDNCGKDVLRSKNSIQGHIFCDIKCRDEFNAKVNEENRINNLEIRKCEQCNKEFECDKNSDQRFCSHECVWESNKGERPEKWKRTDTKCTWCNKDIKVKNNLYNTWEHHFCNRECFNNWLKNVYSQTEEYKNKSRQIALKNLKSGVFNKTDTLIQRKINNLLNKMNINYENEKIVDFYSVDNYLIDSNLLIEVNGDYWHTNPLKYDNVCYEPQLNKIFLDKSKHTFIKNKYHINILYLWEDDINNNINKCKNLIENYVNNKGKLKNYNSFNYNNIDYSLNKNIVKQYMEWDKDKLNNIIDIKLKEERQGRLKDPDKWIIYNCDICGQEVSQLKSVYNKNKNHFCSQECKQVFSRLSTTMKCDNCGADILVQGRKVHNKYHFCDEQCEKNFKHKSKKIVKGNCEVCGKEFEQKEYDYNKSRHHYCSYECCNKAKINKVIVKCSSCGKPIERTKGELKKNITGNYFCSKECESNFKKDNVNMDVRIIFNCEICGKEVTQLKSTYDKQEHHFCSDKCSGQFRRKQITFNCENCGKEKTMKISKYNLSKHHYCCYACSVEGKRKAKIDKTA